MKILRFALSVSRRSLWLSGLFLAFAVQNVAGQFFEISADISVSETDLMKQQSGGDVRRWSYSPRCLVSSNMWFIEERLGNARHYYWFTGSNVIKHVLITREPLAQDLQDVRRSLSHGPPSVGGRLPHVGAAWTNVFALADGRPPHNMIPSLPWLAFCSGAALRCAERELPTPLEGGSYYSDGRFDKTSVYPDRFGLPKHVEFYTREGRLVSIYEVHQRTNLFGVSLPLEFSATQSNTFKRSLVSGKVTSIREVERFEVPAEVSNGLGPTTNPAKQPTPVERQALVPGSL